jgi:hypothetical protein
MQRNAALQAVIAPFDGRVTRYADAGAVISERYEQPDQRAPRRHDFRRQLRV